MEMKIKFKIMILLCCVLCFYIKATAQNVILNAEEAIERLIDIDQIKGVEVLTVMPAKDSPLASKFGHVSLRFVKSDGDWTNDLVIEFVADVNEANISYLKGITGGYKAIIYPTTFFDYWYKYSKHEGRHIVRSIVQLDEKRKIQLISNTVNILKNPAALSEYTFFSNNCAAMLARLLALSLGENGFRVRVPVNFDEHLSYHYFSLWPRIVMSDLNGPLKKINLIAKSVDEREMTTRIIEEMSEREIKLLLETGLLPSSIAEELRVKYSYREGATYDEVFRVAPIDNILYRLCFDEICRDEQVKKAIEFFGVSEIKEHSELLQNIYNGSVYKQKNLHKEEAALKNDYWINLILTMNKLNQPLKYHKIRQKVPGHLPRRIFR